MDGGRVISADIKIETHHDFQPGNGTRYHLTLIEDPNGGVLVIWPTQSTHRWYPKYGELKFLHGKLNTYDSEAIQIYLNGLMMKSFQEMEE